MSLEVTRDDLLELLEEVGVTTTRRGKPISNANLAKLVVQKKSELVTEEDGDEVAVNELAGEILDAIDEEVDIEVTGDDPTVKKAPAKKAAAAKKTKKVPPAAAKKTKKPKKTKKVADEEAEEGEEEVAEKKPKKKAASKRDEFGGSPTSQAGQVNAVLLGNKRKKMTIDQMMEQLDESITRTRVSDHLRRLLRDELVECDAKGRYSYAQKA